MSIQGFSEAAVETGSDETHDRSFTSLSIRMEGVADKDEIKVTPRDEGVEIVFGSRADDVVTATCVISYDAVHHLTSLLKSAQVYNWAKQHGPVTRHQSYAHDPLTDGWK